MHDFRDDYEMDEDGRLRKKRVAGDGERISFTMQMMDAARGFHQTFSDGSVDHTHWSRPGYRFADTNDADRLAADQAYEQMRTRLNDGWRNKRVLAPEKRDVAPSRVPTLDQLQVKAQQAWEQRNERLRNAWRTSKEA